MKKILSFLLVIFMIVSAVFAVPFTAYAKDIDMAKTSAKKTKVYVDVSAVMDEGETLGAYVWNDYDTGSWRNVELQESGCYAVEMKAHEYAVFAIMKDTQIPDWNFVVRQTDDVPYLGDYNCAVLSHSDAEGRMNVEWKNVDFTNKTYLDDAMRRAEKYLYEDADKYTKATVANLEKIYKYAKDYYALANEQYLVDEITYYLNETMFYRMATIKEDGTVNKSSLSQAISTAVSYEMSLAPFTAYSWNYMIYMRNMAYSVNTDEEATQDEVDAAALDLYDAIDGLEIEMQFYGDIDGDGNFTIMDATVIQCYLARIKIIPMSKHRYADMNKDGVVSIMDATQIQRILVEVYS
ncbi:MAG: dockerin type I repeat-containing protein [Ruminococcus sp.]|nr:dockerin type I repeat-containing protein [Ruminococcus sp.]